MPFAMYRVFCAAPGNLEPERQAFHEAIGDFNELHGIPAGILLVPVSLPINMTDKRVYQAAIDANVRSCRYFVQVLHDTWGPAAMNFEREFAMAAECAGRAVLIKAPGLELPEQAAAKEFRDLDEFKSLLLLQFKEWLATIPK